MADEKQVKFKVTADGAQAEGEFRRVRKTLEELKESFGRGSTFQETAELFKGGGVALGLSVVGETLNEWSKKAVELRDQFNESKTNIYGMVEGLAQGLPIVGAFWQTGRNIRELFTGDEASLREQLKLVKAITEADAEQRKGIESLNSAHDKAAEARQKASDEAQLASLASPLKELAKLQQDAASARRQIQKDENEGLAGAGLASMRQKLDVLQRQKQSLQEKLPGLNQKVFAEGNVDADQLRLETLDSLHRTNDAIAAQQALMRAAEGRIRDDAENQQRAIDARLKAQRAEILGKFDTELRASFAARVKAQLESLKDALVRGGAELDQAISDRATAFREQQVSAANARGALFEIASRGLDEEIAKGNTAAAIEKQRLEILERTTAERQRLNEIIGNDSTPQDLKDQAAQLLKALPQIQADQLADVIATSRQQRLTQSLAPTNNQRFLSGAAESQRAGFGAVDPSVTTAKNTAKASDWLEKLYNFIVNHTGSGDAPFLPP